MKNHYIVIGSNNFWYASMLKKKDAVALAKRLMKRGHTPDEYADPESGLQPYPPEECVYVLKVASEQIYS